MLERFFSARVVDALAGQGVIGTFASPRDPGTAYVAWHHSSGRLTGYPGAWTYVRGGMGNVSFALARAAREAGATVATGAPVRSINPGEGVELEDGTTIPARAVVCNADARRALAMLDGSAPAALRERVEAVPMQSPVLKVNFALAALPEFPAAAHATRGTVNVTGGADAMHAGCRLAQAGDVADELWCELYFQTVADPSVAPDGRHVMSAFCQYVPYALAEGDWDARRDEMADRVEASIERFAPGFRDLVVEREALAPPDVERKIGLTGGHIFQGECLPAFMWDRRLPYRTGAEGVYLCGAGTHPGGSVIAVNGRNAALAVLADLG
jgi:phytoene dehydrogenase-like protein